MGGFVSNIGRKYRHAVMGCALLTVVGCYATSPAPNKPPHPVGGDVELGGSLDFSSLDPDESSVETNLFLANAELGFFLSEVFELGPELTVRLSSTDSDDNALDDVDTADYSAGGFLRLNIPTESVFVPFAEVRGGILRRDIDVDEVEGGDDVFEEGDDDGPYAGAGIGTRIFVADGAALNVSARYTKLFLEDEVGGDLDVFSILAGFSVFF